MRLLCISIIFVMNIAHANDPVIVNTDNGYKYNIHIKSSPFFSTPYLEIIDKVYQHICSPEKNTFVIKSISVSLNKSDYTDTGEIKENVKHYFLHIRKHKPQNKMVWNTHTISDFAGVVIDGKVTFPKMPTFECTLWGNTIQIKYAYGREGGYTDKPIIYGDTYNESTTTELTADMLSRRKFIAIFVNGKQVSAYIPYSLYAYSDIFTFRTVFEYKLDDEKKQYYLDITTGPYTYNDIEYGTPHGNPFFLEYTYHENNKIISREEYGYVGWEKYYIKLYHNITQPDGTVSP